MRESIVRTCLLKLAGTFSIVIFGIHIHLILIGLEGIRVKVCCIFLDAYEYTDDNCPDAGGKAYQLLLCRQTDFIHTGKGRTTAGHIRSIGPGLRQGHSLLASL